MLARRRWGRARTGAVTGLALGTVLLAGCSGAPSGGVASPTAGGSTSSSTTPATTAPTPSVSSTSSSPSTSTSSAPPSSSSSAPSASGSASPQGTQITSRNADFSVEVPEKWADISNQFQDLAEIQLAARAPKPTDGIPLNITVSSSQDHYQGSSQAAADQMVKEYRKHGAHVSQEPSTQVGGVSSTGIQLQRTVNAKKVVQIQYFVVHDNRLFVPTGTAAPADAPALQKVLGSVLDSWQWS